MTKLLSVQQLNKSFKDSNFRINNVSFEVHEGEIVALIGKNGSGKSTLIRMIAGDYPIDQGTVSFFGAQPSMNDTAYKNEISVVFDALNFPKKFTVKMIDKIFKQLYTNWNSAQFFAWIKKFELPANQQVKQFSRGMSMKVSMAAALSHQSRLLILDEATAGLDAASRGEIQDELEKFVHEGNRAILMTSHIAEDVERLATRLFFIKNGEVAAQISKRELFESFGILNCDAKQFSTLDKESILAYKEHLGQFEVLLKKDNSEDIRSLSGIDEANKIILGGTAS
ncbi:putative ABC transporter ATP-binding protein [Staphylococcus piscifermentans]|uniref:ABC transporter ATP-binding protein n=1 Tax=Staphylococcus piscifermentans TaxID=70258 RepID=A0A239TQQ7_9STAP|nr:ABC transporter ATP-binding protein [Staphylococcus piscifermentans]RTX84537.1 ABC transporter ATP-binding protein [Staphylococcus piscifermentans]GEP84795.1 ABC transporter ATP-binding protein [Staphylococcus piscifermentans]SNU98913.1 putative ABC transporter ATP-binding protein [Staphylococcus piscifermentans]